MSQFAAKTSAAQPQPFPLRLTALAAVCAGVMATVAMPPFHGTGWLIVASLTILFALLCRTDRPALIGWLFGVAHQGSLLHWLFLLGPEAPIASRVLVPVAAGSAILYVSLYYLLFGWLAGQVARIRDGRVTLLAVPFLWTVIEVLRTTGELGFPWCLSGMAFLQSALYPLAAGGGELALGTGAAFAAALVVAAAGVILQRDERTTAIAVALALACLVLWGGLTILATDGDVSSTRPSIRVAAVQADVALCDKWAKGRTDSTTVPYTALTHEAVRRGAELVVWAETAVPAYLMYERRLLGWVRDLADSTDVFIFTGFPDANLNTDGKQVRTNASGLFGANGRLLDRYHKHHLLPFGERVPFQKWLPWLGKLDFGQAEWHAGEKPHPISVSVAEGRELRFGALVCYEAIFSSLSRHAVAEGANVLVNITNDGWFGETAGPVQHAAMARMRAAECRVPVVRCANNGISFMTDRRGGLIDTLGLGERGLVIRDLTPGPADTTFIRHGQTPLAIFMAAWTLVVIAFAVHRRR